MEPSNRPSPGLRRWATRAFPELVPPLGAFGRLCVTHILMISGDAFVTVALAGSLFFSISPSAARSRVALYLLLTMAPFAVVAPMLGPLLDRSRGVRRAMVVGSAAARVVLCLLMARHLHSLLLFPEAFLILVASKLYLVAKAALVPATVESGPSLVRANARLALLSALAGLAAALPASAIWKIPFLGAPWVLRADALIFLAAAFSAARLPRARPVPAGGEPGEWEEDGEPTLELEPVPAGAPHPPPAPPVAGWMARVLVSASAMAVLRMVVGLVTFLLAFELRRQHAATWWFGVVLAASVGGSMLATLVAPVARRHLREETILLSGLIVVAAASIGAFEVGGHRGAAVLSAAVGLGAGGAKLAFDALVQRDVPETRRGRAFSRFETRFQLAWVVGALVPVVIPLSDSAGELVVAVMTATTAGLYAAGRGVGGTLTTTVRATLSWMPWRRRSQNTHR
ncbi:MAG TPA: MFS transporter [Acidimicrobiales bacterium]|nr:MFS transporter [Acidimicrobiales bacterium]